MSSCCDLVFHDLKKYEVSSCTSVAPLHVEHVGALFMIISYPHRDIPFLFIKSIKDNTVYSCVTLKGAIMHIKRISGAALLGGRTS